MLRLTNRFAWALLGMALITVSACGKKPVATPDRPHAPWAFRSVLDSTPRVLTLALHDNLWVAYRTDSCALFKAWKGHVVFQGAVYDQAHGPQPITIGDAWLENPYLHPWQVTKDGNDLLQEVRYGGHGIHQGQATLHFDLLLKDGGKIRVNERPEYVEKSGQTGLERVYTLEGAPDGVSVSVAQQVTSVPLEAAVETNGQWTIDQQSKKDLGGKQSLTLDGRLTLLAGEPTYFRTFFISRPSIPGKNRANEEDELLPLGERLIAKNDCKTCHNIKATTIGPSYVQIAQRYPYNEESVNTLVKKVIAGGNGIWGIQMMSPHPELPLTDAEEMVRFILRLDTTDAGQREGTAAAEKFTATLQSGDGLLPGLLTEAWVDRFNLNKIPARSTLGAPDQAGINSQWQGIDPADFGGLQEDFVLRAEGYLYVEQETQAGLRVWSDDGSRISIDGKVVLDNDGLHGNDLKETNLILSPGYHDILVEFLQGKGGRYLSIEWQPGEATSWTAIPEENLFHRSADHTRIQGKALSMTIGRQVPGDRSPLLSVHPSYDLFQARPETFTPKVGGIGFMSDGSMIVSVWDPSGGVYRLTDPTNPDPLKIQVKQIAEGLAEPLGLTVINDTIYVLQKQELTRLVDTDKDGIIDEYQCVSNRWPVSANFHEFAFGLAEKDGDLYATLAIAIQPGGASGRNQISSRGKCVRFDLPSGDVSYIAAGLRTPNGIGIGVDGELFIADNQGDWLPSSKILHVTQGAFFGCRAVDSLANAPLPDKPPVVWLPQDEIGNSPSTPLALNDGPYKGQMIHGEVTHGGVKRVFVEKVDGEYQGVVFRFIQGLEAGVNRIAWGPDGSLYAGGVGNPGNWGQSDKLWYGLQRLKYNGNPTFEMLAVRAKSDGFEIEFTEPLREGDGWTPADWEVRQWRYVPTADYGGPKIDDKPLKVVAASVSEDRKRVALKLEGMKPGHVVYFHMNQRYISDSGLPLWAPEAWYTLNRIPSNQPVAIRANPGFAPNTLTVTQQSAGWELLFDGKTTNGWHTYNKDRIGASWVVRDGALTLDAKKNPSGHWQAADGGDIVTTNEYEGFELELEWKISPCGNSGIMWAVVESPDIQYPWETGPEMQILDNACHPDTRFRSHRAGDLYDMIECDVETVKPAGEWNQVRLIKKDGHVEHWLNGRRVVAYTMYTDAWDAMVAKSKFKDMPKFGKSRVGKICLQDHGDPVWFRNIRIRKL